jgi:RNA polymerase primary sigma factor
MRKSATICDKPLLDSRIAAQFTPEPIPCIPFNDRSHSSSIKKTRGGILPDVTREGDELMKTRKQARAGLLDESKEAIAGEDREIPADLLQEIRTLPLLTAAQERSLCERIKLGDRAAYEHMILANIRLAECIAKRYQGHGVPLVDLVQEGVIGMMHALAKFNHKKGYKFSTYAIWWIKQIIRRACADQSRAIRIPVYAEEILMRLHREADLLAQELNHDPTPADLAERLNVRLEFVESLLQSSKPMLSLGYSTEEDECMGDWIPDTDLLDTEQLVDQSFLKAQIQEWLSHLSVREHYVLVARYGLDGQETSYDEIGTQLRVSRTRAKQIEQEALAKLRSLAEQHHIQDWM